MLACLTAGISGCSGLRWACDLACSGGQDSEQIIDPTAGNVGGSDGGSGLPDAGGEGETGATAEKSCYAKAGNYPEEGNWTKTHNALCEA